MTKPIPEFDVEQQASFWSRVDVRGPNDCWDWKGGKGRGGYGRIKINGRFIRAHRYILSLSAVPNSDGLMALHSCDNPPCCNPAHLRWGTGAENMADKVKRGRQTRIGHSGMANGRALLDGDDITAIIQSPLNHKEAAKRFGVSAGHISKIRRGIRWAHTA